MLTQNNGFDHTGYNSLIALSALLSSVRYSPCNNKKYYLQKWHSSPKPISYCQAEITAGRANGYGIITGEIEGLGILVLDFDGVGSDELAGNISPTLLEDNTLAWSSGKAGHFSKAFVIPKPHLPFWSGVQKHDISTDSVEINSPHLEIRYNHHASVIPPSAHPETGSYKWLNDGGVRHLTFDESYALLDKCTVVINNDLTGDQELNLIEEALTFIPSDDYHVWTTVGMALYRHGCDYSLWDNWSAQSAKYDPKGMDKKWQSFAKANRVNIGTLFHLASVNGFDQRRWMRENLKRQRQALNHTIKNDPTEPKEISKNEIIKLTNKFLEEKSKILREDERLKETTDFCNQYNLPFNPIWKTLEAKVERSNEQLEHESLNSYLDDLLNIPKKKLELKYLVGDFYAQVLTEVAKAINSSPDALFLMNLPVLATAIGLKDNLTSPFGHNWTIQPKLRIALVADSGKSKTPTFDSAIEELQKLNAQWAKEYQEEFSRWEQLDKEAKAEEEKPVKHTIMTKDITFDGLYKTLVNNPSILVARNELAGYFSSLSSNKGYNGDNAQRSLELYDNAPIDKLRQDNDLSYYIENHCVSFLGTLQWTTLGDLIQSRADIAGESPRWFFIAPELPEIKAVRADKESSKTWCDVQQLIINNLFYAQGLDLTFSEEATTLLETWFNETTAEARIDAVLPQDKSRKIKILGDCMKIAHLLHRLCLEILPELIEDESVIGEAITERAICLSDYLLAHFTYCITKAQDGDGLVGGKEMRVLEKIIEAGDKGINMSRLQGKLGGGNKSAMPIEEVKKCVLTLEDMKKVILERKNGGIRVKAI